MDLKTLTEAISKDAALRRRQKLQPVGGQGDKIFPPTYPSDVKNAPPRHVYEKRRQGDREIWCALVDSVQSQANRLEDCLLQAFGEGARIPHVVVDFSTSGLAGVSKITSLDAPHRVYDAILRDSLFDGKPFLHPGSAIGRRLLEATMADASALLETSPNALLFGAWNSTGQGGGLGAKFARCLVSEVVAIDVPVQDLVDRRTGEVSVQTAGRRTGSRIDPLGVVSRVKVFKGANGWDVDKEAAGASAKEVRPSEINHGNIAPSVQPLGVTCDYLEHSFVLSFAALRRLRFGEAVEKNQTARAMLASLGLLAMAEQDARGYALRSRCDLVCEGVAPLELVHADGQIRHVQIDLQAARSLYDAAFTAAIASGFAFASAPVRLTPQDKLVEIVRRSQDLALRGAGEDGGEDGSGA